MQQLSSSSLRSYSMPRESAQPDAELQRFQRALIICPQCETQCQAIGKVRNNWYTLCKCGTYTQLCNSATEYCD